MDSHLCTPLDLRPALAGRTADDLGYMAVNAVGYTDGNRRSLRQLEQVPWTLDAIRGRGELVDLPSPTLVDQAEALARIAHAVAAANTLSGEAEFEAAVFTPKGMTRLLSRRFSCRVIANSLLPQGPDQDLGAPAPSDNAATLETADALAATPGMNAVMAATLKLSSLMSTVPDVVFRHLQSMEAMWRRVVDGKDAEIKHLRDQVDRLTDLLLAEQAAADGHGVPPEMLKEAAEEVGGTLKAGLMAFLGAPHEAVTLLNLAKEMPPELRSKLSQPATIHALEKPEVRNALFHLLSNLEAA